MVTTAVSWLCSACSIIIVWAVGC